MFLRRLKKDIAVRVFTLAAISILFGLLSSIPLFSENLLGIENGVDMLSYACFFVQALLLSFIIRENNMDIRPLMVGIFYLLLAFLQPQSFPITYHLAIFSLLISVHYFLQSVNKKENRLFLYNACFFWAVSCLFYPNFVWTLIALLLIVLSLPHARSAIMGVSLFGLLTPPLMYAAYLFLQGKFETFSVFPSIPDIAIIDRPDIFVALHGFAFLVSLIFIFKKRKYTLDTDRDTKEKMKVLSFAFFSFWIWALMYYKQGFAFFPAYICSAYFMSQLFQKAKETLLLESLLWLFLGLVLIQNFTH